MRRSIILVLPLLCLLTCLAVGQDVAPCGGRLPAWNAPENLADVTAQLVRYHDFGQYEYEIGQVTHAAMPYVDRRTKEAKPDERLAAVFDIDETALSNWAKMLDCGFCAYKIQDKLYGDAPDPAIPSVLELFKYAAARGVKMFFITGRPESQRGMTTKNLTDVGYSGWEDLIMRPNGNTDPATVFKSARRRAIADKGYTIMINVGDQASDLAGCCAERTFKLPNPFYLVP
jgi:acid phosphatase